MIDKLFLVQDFRAFITLPVPVTNQQQLNSQTPYYAIELRNQTIYYIIRHSIFISSFFLHINNCNWFLTPLIPCNIIKINALVSQTQETCKYHFLIHFAGLSFLTSRKSIYSFHSHSILCAFIQLNFSVAILVK